MVRFELIWTSPHATWRRRKHAVPQSAPIDDMASQKLALCSRLLERPLPQGWARNEVPTITAVIQKQFGKADIEAYHCPADVCATASRLVLVFFNLPASADGEPTVAALVKNIFGELGSADRNAGEAPYPNHIWLAGTSRQTHGAPAAQMKRGSIAILQSRDTDDGWQQRARARLVTVVPVALPRQ